MATRQSKRPTPALVQQTIEKIRHAYSDQGAALKFLLGRFPLNQHLAEVIIKVATIDSLFKTNLGKLKMTKGDMFAPVARRIIELHIDSLFSSQSPPIALVTDMALVRTDARERRLYVFASKYCCWHRPDVYPRIDARVRERLLDYQNSYGSEEGFPKFSGFELNNQDARFDYARFKEIIEEFRNHFGLEQFNFDDLDQFLWGYGKEL